ncbi:hypothetical protein K443DRAFT_670788 [Laccaria amethystina LaAM-08-1]|uniref:Uncharacterized protein n=1 Tax=Laccaria amethystina LaAM-08-1 TaxID=1095629 RepID=A0A0C9XYZ5_9AGAR|nr:hypothetical protein K443DRAFT_670788 [Laccaria amethystina LaAM-08-1]
MPLPDERPRASVANLIGRFENQSKRVSSSGPPPAPRSSSVISHTTGDSTKEEVKEKREWPPRPFATTDKPPVVLPSYIRPPPPPTQPTMAPWLQPAPVTIPDSPIATTEVPVDNALPATIEVERATPGPSQSQRQNNLDAPSLTKTKSATSARASIAMKSRAAASNPPNPRSKTPVKSPGPKQSLASATIQPLKPQHTGQSVTSTTSVRKAVTKPPIPSTPSRSKTPSKPVSSIAYSKSSTSPPKTPSTGLFAPTAASLARSRNAQPQLPTPTKKPTLSSSSADRLSKPTAASLSKARTPPTASPASVARSPPSNRNALKPKVAASATKEMPTSNAEVDSAIVAIAEPREPDNNAGEHNKDEQTHEVVVDAASHADPVEDTSAVFSGSAIDLSIQVGEPHEPEGEFCDGGESNQSPVLSSLDTNDTLVDTEEDEKTEELDSFKSTGTDIEDIVNLLETNALSKLHSETAASVPNIPDEVHDIPDEE